MRILHLVHQYPPDAVGGTELYTQAIAGALVQRNHYVSVFHRRNTGDRVLERGSEDGIDTWAAQSGEVSPLHRFRATFGDPILERAFAQIIDEAHPQLVHIQHLMGLPLGIMRQIRARRIPYIVTLHDYWWVCANAQLLTNDTQQLCDGPQRFLNCARCALARAGWHKLAPMLPLLALPLSYRNRLLRTVLRNASQVLAPTDFVRKWYAKHGVPQDKLIVLPPALKNPPLLSRSDSGSSVRFAYIGGLSWQKGVHVLIEAFAGVQGPGELWIAGDESFDPAYAAHLRAQASPGVRFLGKLSRKEVWDTLRQVDVVAVPSLWHETFSLLVSEAFAQGVPVVASRLGSLTDRIRDGIDGLLAPPGDVNAWRSALQRLLDEPDLRTTLRSQIRPPDTLDEHVTRLEEIYERVIFHRS